MPILSRKNAILTTTEKIVSINGLDLPATVVFKSTNIGAEIYWTRCVGWVHAA